MRKIDLPLKPAQLTKEVQDRLTEAFLENPDKKVWDRPYIKEALLNMTYHKCAYSEVVLQENSSYMEVEHFYPKSLYPHKVVEWGNMLPVCKVCNNKKGKADPKEILLINPLTDEPSRHLSFQHYLCKPLDEKGSNSIQYYDLNHSQFTKPRFTQIQSNEKQLDFLAKEMEENITESAQGRFAERFKVVLQTGQKTEPYSVCISLAIISNKHYDSIKAYLKRIKLWDCELEILDAGLTCKETCKTGAK